MLHCTEFRRPWHAPKVALCFLLLPGIARFGTAAGQDAGTAVSAGTAATVPFILTPVAPGVERITGMRGATGIRTAPAQRRESYRLTVPAEASSGQWTDTGIDVAAGEALTLTATGTVTLADGRRSPPAGLTRGWRDLLRQFPDNAAGAGALVGRVSSLDASVPFPVVSGEPVTMPTTGRLFLAVNAPADLAGTGSYSVTLRFPRPATSIIPAAAKASSTDLSLAALAEQVTPAVFATMPRRVEDAHGDPGDMVNFALLGTEAQVESAFRHAGWVAVDKNVGDAIMHGLLATLGHEAYTEMPMSTLYLFGRPQDLSFARADPLQVVSQRHHLRAWRTGQTIGGEPLWVGSATHDIGLERDSRSKAEGGGGITHRIDPDVDLERQFLLQSFDATGGFDSAALLTPASPLRNARTATGGSFHSDGRVLVMAVK